MPENKEFLKQLVSLVQLDIDAVHAYTAAINRIDLKDVKEQLISFRSDHERHISDLSPFITRFGGEIPNRNPDLKGFFLQGFTALSSMVSNETALRAMKANEELTNKNYDKALGFGFESDILSVIQKNREDERRHLLTINQWIDQKIWDVEQRTVA